MVDGFIDGCEIQKSPRQTNYSPYRKKISASLQVSFQYLLLTLLWYKISQSKNVSILHFLIDFPFFTSYNLCGRIGLFGNLFSQLVYFGSKHYIIEERRMIVMRITFHIGKVRITILIKNAVKEPNCDGKAHMS